MNKGIIQSIFNKSGRKQGISIAVVSDAVYPWHTGGKETRYQELLKRLPGLGLDVEIYTMNWWGGKEMISGDIRYRAISPKFALYSGNRRSIFQSVMFALACFRLLFTGRFDIIEADHMPYLQLYPLRIVAWLRRVPLIVTWHEVWGERYWEEYLGGISGRVAALIERIAFRIPDHIVAVSSGTAEELIRAGVPIDRVSVLWAGVSVTELDLVEPALHSPDVICAGRLMPHKRIDVVLDALALLRSREIYCTLAITGTGPEMANLQTQCEKLEIEDLVTFYGELSTSVEVWALMKGARVCAAPSEREGFGLAVAESLAAGTPVVVVDHPSNASRHLVDDGVTGSIITPGSVDELAISIAYWLEHTHEHHSQGVRFEERHPHLTWDGLAERYSELIKRSVR